MVLVFAKRWCRRGKPLGLADVRCETMPELSEGSKSMSDTDQQRLSYVPRPRTPGNPTRSCTQHEN